MFLFRGFAQTGPAGVGSSVNNVFWLKADAGTSSSANNTPISSWNDQSGNAINMTQTVAAQQPSFVTNVMNGFPAVRFDNTSSTNDKMIGPDSPLLDNTSGYSFFTVSQLLNTGDARVIVSKRVNVGVDQSFMLFYYTSSKFNVDIQTNNDRFTSNFSYATGTNYIIDLIYDGTLPSASRVNLYLGETLDRTATETSTAVLNNASPILLGSTDAGDGRPFGGYISEVIIYREALIPAQRIIVNNYLSAKYNIALSANDKYAGDDNGNGDYDRQVAGIGQEATGATLTFSPSVSGGLGISATGGFQNGDYVLAGHNSVTNDAISTDVGGMTGSQNARWARTWYLDITNTSSNITANLYFDMSEGGVGNITPGVFSNYVLLYRAGSSGNWTELAVASAISGDQVWFNGITLSSDGYYTIGTRNSTSSILPLRLTDFSARRDLTVELQWHTADETGVSEFQVERSEDGILFTPVEKLPGRGKGGSYRVKDLHAPEGLLYYRLKVTEAENFFYSRIVTVMNGEDGIAVYPNPANDKLIVRCPACEGIAYKIFSGNGSELLSGNIAGESLHAVPINGLAPGTYYLKLYLPGGEKIITFLAGF